MSMQYDENAFGPELIRSVHSDRVREWLPEVPQDVAKTLFANKRLHPTLTQMIASHYNIAVGASHAEPGDKPIMNLSHASLAKIIGMAGLIWHSHRVRAVIDKQELLRLLAGMDENAYHMAMAQPSLTPGKAETDKDAEALTSKILWRDGYNCFFAWLETLPPPGREWIVLKFPPDFAVEPVTPPFRDYGPKIIRILMRGLVANDSK